MPKVGVGLGIETHPLEHRSIGDPAQIVARAHAIAFDLRRDRARFEQRQHRQAQRLERHLVAHRLAAHLQLCSRRHRSRCTAHRFVGERPPFNAVEARQHRTAKIQRFLRRHTSAKAHAQRDAVVQRDFGDRSHAHAVRQAGHCHAVLRHAPQRSEAREQHEHQGHDRRAEEGRARRQRARLAQTRLTDRHVGEHERGQQSPHRDQHRCSHRQRLRIEKVCQHDEEAEEEDDEGIAPRAQLERLQRHQRDRHRDAGFFAEQRPVRPERQSCGQQQHRDDDPAPRERRVVQCELRAPQQHRGGQQRAPQRQMRHMRQHRPRDHAQQEQRVARVARQVAPVGEPERQRHSAKASRQLRRCASPCARATSRPGKPRP